QLRQAPPQAESGDLRRELDRQHGISEAAERGRAVDPAGDEQERQHPGEPDHEPEDVEPPAAGEGRHVGIGRAGFGAVVRDLHSLCVGQCASPQWRPQPTSTSSGTSSFSAGSCAVVITWRMTAAAASSRPIGTSNTNSSWTCSSIFTSSSPAWASALSIRAIARLMRSALVPWIGALIAARSAPPRIDGLGERMLGSKWVLRPNRVLVKPCSRANASVLCMNARIPGKRSKYRSTIALPSSLASPIREAIPQAELP